MKYFIVYLTESDTCGNSDSKVVAYVEAKDKATVEKKYKTGGLFAYHEVQEMKFIKLK